MKYTLRPDIQLQELGDRIQKCEASHASAEADRLIAQAVLKAPGVGDDDRKEAEGALVRVDVLQAKLDAQHGALLEAVRRLAPPPSEAEVSALAEFAAASVT